MRGGAEDCNTGKIANIRLFHFLASNRAGQAIEWAAVCVHSTTQCYCFLTGSGKMPD